MFIRWIHHLFNPHCVDCFQIKMEEQILKDKEASCKSCELLRELLYESRQENKRLSEIFLGGIKPNEPVTSKEEYKPISNFTPWKVKREMLEAEDREKARIMRQVNKDLNEDSISKLEDKLNLEFPVQNNG